VRGADQEAGARGQGDAPAADGVTVAIEHHPERERFEAMLDGERAELVYRRMPGRLLLLHTGVPVAFRVRGIGTRLVRAALDYARAEGLAVVPYCPFVRAFIKKHPDYQDLVTARPEP